MVLREGAYGSQDCMSEKIYSTWLATEGHGEPCHLIDVGSCLAALRSRKTHRSLLYRTDLGPRYLDDIVTRASAGALLVLEDGPIEHLDVVEALDVLPACADRIRLGL